MKHARPTRTPTRHLAIVTAALLAWETAAAVTAGAQAATLRPNVVVHEDIVRLRDIFDGAGHNADVALFRAPAPGQSVVLPTNWLRQVARAYELDWRPLPGFEEGRIERSSNRVSPEVIVGALSRALEERISSKKRFEITLDNPSTEIRLPVQLPSTAIVKRLDFDERSNRFSAVIAAPDDRPHATTIQVAGRVHELVEVPVLSNRLRNGEIIRKKDVEMQLRRVDRLDRNMLTSPEQIIGKSARGTLLSGKPLSSGNVREPQLVSRGGSVIMTYRTANISISAHGTARENGTAGDTVRVRNTNSGKIVEAVVTGLDTVTVLPLTSAAMR